MPLNQDAKIDDVLKVLNDIVCINDKPDVVQILGAPNKSSDNWSTIKTNIQNSKNKLATNLTNKGITANNTDSLDSLAGKVANILKGQGNAIESDVLKGKTFTNSDGILRTGTVDLGNLKPENVKKNVNINGIIGNLEEDSLGLTKIVGSSHPTTNAPLDLASIRLEFYNRIFPNNLNNIQVLKNGISNVYANAKINSVASGNSSDEESIYISLNESFYPNTKYKVILTNDCIKDKFNNNFKELSYEFTTASNPSVWVNNPTGTLTNRFYHCGFGTQDSAICICGGSSTGTKSAELFNGTTWAGIADTISSAISPSGCGTVNAGMYYGGNNGIASSGNSFVLKTTYLYNGTSWGSSNINIVGKWNHVCCGIQNDSISICGQIGTPTYTNSVQPTDSVEKFNGTTWAAANNMINKITMPGGCGNANSALVFGGYEYSGDSEKSDILIAKTYKYNGTSWVSSNNLNVAGYNLVGSGEQNSALSFSGSTGGNTVATRTGNTEKFNGNTWSVTSSLNTARTISAGCGAQQNALCFGGATDYISPNLITTSSTEKFFS